MIPKKFLKSKLFQKKNASIRSQRTLFLRHTSEIVPMANATGVVSVQYTRSSLRSDISVPKCNTKSHITYLEELCKLVLVNEHERKLKINNAQQAVDRVCVSQHDLLRCKTSQLSDV